MVGENLIFSRSNQFTLDDLSHFMLEFIQCFVTSNFFMNGNETWNLNFAMAKFYSTGLYSYIGK